MESRKSKKRTNKKNNTSGNWVNNSQYDQSNNAMSNMEYPQVVWQPGIQSHVPNHNGQRLFAAMSDPSVCSYSPMPMTYTMEPVSLPTMYRLYQPMPYGVQNTHARLKQKFNPKPPVIPSGYTSLQENKNNSTILSSYQNGDYASLPPVANKSNGINEDEISSEHRRYSDPGLGPTESSIHNQEEDSDSGDSSSSVTTIGRSNKLVLSLIEQMAELKKSNGQLFKELSEAKFELETMKLKFSEFKHSSDYQPGMLSDLIREIREANKMCEEGLVIKIQSMMEEKSNQRFVDIELLKGQISKLVKEKEESERRVSKLEEEVAILKTSANNEGREIAAFEEETLALRRELQEALATRNLTDGTTKHGTKCVNAISRSVTPVIFETPRITSTPVRTALTETCNLVPAISSSIPSTSVVSDLRSRSSEYYRLLDRDNKQEEEKEEEEKKANLLKFGLAESMNEGKEHDKMVMFPAEPPLFLLANEENVEQLESVQENRRNEKIDEAERTRAAGGGEKEKERGGGAGAGTGTGTGTNTNANTSSNQRKGSKRSRKKKTAAARKTDDNKEDSIWTTRLVATTPSNTSPIINEKREKEEEEARRSPRDRLVVENVPEVTVVDGGSFVPKDLCSGAGILTSRVLTAPSRATYTTAYI
ncbi:PREDICTED: uncharacterized protein LOC106788765 isoform X1 [Polistes canadensis]|uniref:uncharacterized protein LOC106788765 isoform X1 n=1 Tax=Polistes canadensis TaxID=91411 RepID=UPI000718E435|nr:PREDICTED: uncharacterized protein LOC106788765 isoform X1 [Polistes canadensis]XP_014607801.1 PREDICTED: uncharacterized protein LOC106788765 isoform X1 [Polistes canadensis]